MLYNIFLKVLQKAFCRKLGKFTANTKLFRIGKKAEWL